MLRCFNSSNPAFVDTYESYSQVVFIGNYTAVIPYINVCLMANNPINSELSVVDYSYYMFSEVQSMSFGMDRNSFNIEFNLYENLESITEYVSISGCKTNGAEVKVICNKMLFYLSDSAEIQSSDKIFIPKDTPNFKRNMDMEKVNEFFRRENLPKEIKEELGDNIYSVML